MNEILVKEIIIEENTVSVYPQRCPGNTNDIPRTAEGEGVCFYNYSLCPYFDKVVYNPLEYRKTIQCRANINES